LRIQKLLVAIEKNDALQENVINRYCVIYAECLSYEAKREALSRELDELGQNKKVLLGEKGMTLGKYYEIKERMVSNLLGIDRQLQAKREMLFRIEKESLMTTAAAMRTVPKQPPKEEKGHGGMFG